MSFFKSFTNKYTALSQDEAALPAPVTAPPPATGFSARFKRLNPFGGPPQLEDDAYVTSEPGMFELSRWDRMLIFAMTFGGACCCWLICIFLFPVLSLKPRKFAILWSLGSVFFLISFGVLQGAQAYVTHLFSSTRILFTVAFFTSIIMTLVSALSLRSTILSLIFAVIQLLAALWYTVSYFPFGTQSLNLASSVARSQVEGWMNS
ncbi:protein transport protein Sft2p [Diutina catenulata]